MSERPRVPAAITLGVVLFIAQRLARDAFLLAGELSPSMEWFWLAMTGVVLVGSLTIATGASDLSGRLSGLSRTGARLVAGALVVDTTWFVVTQIARNLISMSETFHVIHSYANLAFGLAIATGALLARPRGSSIGLVSGVVMFVTAMVVWAPPPLASLIRQGPDTSALGLVLFDTAYVVYFAALWIALRSAASIAQPSVERPHDAVAGIRSLAGALTLRLVVAGVALVLTLFALMAKSKGLVSFITVGVPAFNALSLLQFGLGCLRISRADRAERPTFLVAGCLSLWVFMVSTMQTIIVYHVVKGTNVYWSDAATSLAIPQAIIVIIAITAALAAAAGRARRFGMTESAQRAIIASYTFIVLSLGAVGVSRYVLPTIHSVSGALFASVVIAILGVFAVVSAIKALNAIASETEGTPLPHATAKELAPSANLSS